MASRVSAFRQVGRAGDTAEFVLARGREAEFSRSQMVRTVNVTLREFWERTAAAAEGARQDSKSASEHLYHSGPLSGWGLPTLDEDANGRRYPPPITSARAARVFLIATPDAS